MKNIEIKAKFCEVVANERHAYKIWPIVLLLEKNRNNSDNFAYFVPPNERKNLHI